MDSLRNCLKIAVSTHYLNAWWNFQTTVTILNSRTENNFEIFNCSSVWLTELAQDRYSLFFFFQIISFEFYVKRLHSILRNGDPPETLTSYFKHCSLLRFFFFFNDSRSVTLSTERNLRAVIWLVHQWRNEKRLAGGMVNSVYFCGNFSKSCWKTAQKHPTTVQLLGEDLSPVYVYPPYNHATNSYRERARK